MFSDSKLNNVFSESLKFLSKKDQKIAEYTSSYSDILLWKPHPEDLKSARDCGLILFIGSLVQFNQDSYQQLCEQIRRIAIYRIEQLKLCPENLQVDYTLAKIHEKVSPEEYTEEDRSLLQKYPHGLLSKNSWYKVYQQADLGPIPGVQLRFLLENWYTTNDWFGNCLKRIQQIRRRAKFVNPYLSKRTRVKRPQRKRGYDDKGTLRPSDSLGIEYYKEVQEESFFKDETTWTPQFFPPDVKHITQINNIEQGTLVELSTSEDYSETKEIIQKAEKLKNDFWSWE